MEGIQSLRASVLHGLKFKLVSDIKNLASKSVYFYFIGYVSSWLKLSKVLSDVKLLTTVNKWFSQLKNRERKKK